MHKNGEPSCFQTKWSETGKCASGREENRFGNGKKTPQSPSKERRGRPFRKKKKSKAVVWRRKTSHPRFEERGVSRRNKPLEENPSVGQRGVGVVAKEKITTRGKMVFQILMSMTERKELEDPQKKKNDVSKLQGGKFVSCSERVEIICVRKF